jgi:hypothetical protein
LAQAQAAWQQANTLNRVGDLTDGGAVFGLLEVAVTEDDSMA